MRTLKRIVKNVLNTAKAFRAQKMGILLPFLFFILALSAIMVFIKSMAPLTPFVYSLF